MPVVTIQISKGRPVEQKRDLARRVTQVVAETLNLNSDWVTVLIEEYERENWASGGQLYADKFAAPPGKEAPLVRLVKG